MEKDRASEILKPLSVLMIDDDITFIKVVQYQLQKFQGRKFNLTWKESVEEGLAEIERKPPIDIILTDYNFPSSNGLEFCLKLNQMESKIPILFLTGNRDVKLAVEAMKLGVEDFLVKEDLDQSHLPRAIINAVERVQTRNQIQAVEKRMQIAENRAEAIRELVVTVCHEFNNPLAAVKISADLVQRTPLSEEARNLMEEFDGSFQKIETEIKRLRDINFEKISFHDVAIESEKVQ